MARRRALLPLGLVLFVGAALAVTGCGGDDGGDRTFDVDGMMGEGG